jgi:hypothetical protein
VPPSFDYYAPQSFTYTWSNNGTAIAGATTSSITPAAPGSYSCQVTASNSAGTAAQSSAAVIVKAATGTSTPTSTGTSGATGATGTVGSTGTGAGGAGATVPIASNLRISPSVFTAAPSGPSATTARAKAGAKVSYTLNVAASVLFTVQQRLPGRREGHGKKPRCAPLGKTKRTAHRCTRTVTLPGSFTQAGASGANSLHFSGRLNGHKLRPGAYTLVATPSANGKSGRAISTTFRIIIR